MKQFFRASALASVLLARCLMLALMAALVTVLLTATSAVAVWCSSESSIGVPPDAAGRRVACEGDMGAARHLPFTNAFGAFDEAEMAPQMAGTLSDGETLGAVAPGGLAGIEALAVGMRPAAMLAVMGMTAAGGSQQMRSSGEIERASPPADVADRRDGFSRIPLPTSVSLLLAGLAGLAFLHWRSRWR